MSGYSITELERSRIEALIRRHRERLIPQPSDRKAIAVTLAKMLAAFPAQAQSDAPTEQRIDAYFEALAGIPAWAVDEARKVIITGAARECAGTWAPTPPQLVAVCNRMMEADRRVLADLERIASAEAIEQATEAERERVSGGWDALRSDIAERTGEKPKETPLSAKLRFEEMCREAGVDPTTIKDQPVSMQRLRATG